MGLRPSASSSTASPPPLRLCSREQLARPDAGSGGSKTRRIVERANAFHGGGESRAEPFMSLAGHHPREEASPFDSGGSLIKIDTATIFHDVNRYRNSTSHQLVESLRLV